MTYRDESDALRARVEVLETQLAEANAQIRELKGEGTAPPVMPRAPAKNSFWLGAPSVFDDQRDFDVVPTRDMAERMALVLQRQYPNGHALGTENTLTFRFGPLVAHLAPLGASCVRFRMRVDHSAYSAFAAVMAGMIATRALPFAACEVHWGLIVVLSLPLAVVSFFGFRAYIAT